jgi:hypothetical protein
MIDPRPVRRIDGYTQAFSIDRFIRFLKMNPDLESDDDANFFVWDDLTDSKLLLECREQAIALAAEGKLRDAAFGKLQTTDKQVRSDKLMWMTSNEDDSPLGKLV